jgi:hypothetical protein
MQHICSVSSLFSQPQSHKSSKNHSELSLIYYKKLNSATHSLKGKTAQIDLFIQLPPEETKDRGERKQARIILKILDYFMLGNIVILRTIDFDIDA